MLDLRSQTPKGRRARDRILTAAEGILVTHGFHGTSMRDVAAAAGLPLATLIYHFARKEHLYAAVLDVIGDELLGALDSLPPPGGRAKQAARLDAFVGALLRWSREQPGRVQLLLRELLDNSSRVARASRLPLAPFLERASELVAEGQRTGVLAPQAPELAVLHLVGAVSYVVAARPTVDRILGRARARVLADDYEPEAIACARRILAWNDHARPRSRTGART